MTVSLEKSILWIEDLYFSQKQLFEVKNILMNLIQIWSVSLYTMSTDELMNLWITVMFYQLFELPFWRHPIPAEDLLKSK